MKTGDRKKIEFALLVFAGMLGLGFLGARAEEKPTLVVHAFTLMPGVTWPYDMDEMQSAAITALQAKDGETFNVVPEAATDQAGVYVLDGEVKEWHKGNVAERFLLAAGTVAGRENAKIHYWLTDKNGKKVFDHTDTIRQVWLENGHEKSAGMLAKPFGDKVAERLKEANLEH